MNRPVNVVLDIRQTSDPPTDAAELRELWTRVENYLAGTSLRATEKVVVPLRDDQTCVLWIQDRLRAPDRVDDTTVFSIRGVLEPATVRHRCTTCSAAGVVTYGPFLCSGCDQGDQPGRVCDEHAVVIEGRMTATCARHRPACSCGAAATFWCNGELCRGRNAFCDRHRVGHPGGVDMSYCRDCFRQKFPDCAARGCNSTGSIACEFVIDGRRATCGNAACARHAYRWQIFGPHKRGLGLCPDHALRLKSLEDRQIVFQIVAGTANRRRGPRTDNRRTYLRLPRLTIVRHIFINSRSRKLEIHSIDRMFGELQHDNRTDGVMRRLLQEHEKIRKEDLGAAERDGARGRELFDKLTAWLRARGRAEVANHISFADYRPRSNLLFVNVEPEYMGRFIGRGGAEKRAVSNDLGVRVEVERK
ncbi:KH domain-containing protein [Nocardia sp. NPDC003999]